MAITPVTDESEATPSHTWTFTGVEEGDPVAVPADWVVFGPADSSGTGFSLKWKWAPSAAGPFCFFGESESTAAADGLDSARLSSGIAKPVVGAHTAGTIVAVLK